MVSTCPIGISVSLHALLSDAVAADIVEEARTPAGNEAWGEDPPDIDGPRSPRPPSRSSGGVSCIKASTSKADVDEIEVPF
mmetsp:Transcript_17735/g.32814  ORF Transcript_17735/g.32814 Transcript_17735/m.32814 type:complete len:81 (+) Transcript_17735:103-345(+)